MSKDITITREYDYKDAQYDLDSLFRYAMDKPPFELPATITLYACVMGENDESEWYWVFEYDRQFYYAHGGCDYTGWDCQSWGEVEKADSLWHAINKAPENEDKWAGNRPIRDYLTKMAQGEWQIGVIEA